MVTSRQARNASVSTIIDPKTINPYFLSTNIESINMNTPRPNSLPLRMALVFLQLMCILYGSL